MPVRSPTNLQLSARTITRRSFLVGASAAGLSLAAYGSTHARHEIEVTERTLKIHELPDAFVGFRFLQRAVETINQLNPELVLLTGDFVSRGPASDKYAWRAAGVAAEVLEGLKAPQRYACLGNHDVGVGAGHVITPLVAHGTPLLIDSYVPIQ